MNRSGPSIMLLMLVVVVVALDLGIFANARSPRVVAGLIIALSILAPYLIVPAITHQSQAIPLDDVAVVVDLEGDGVASPISSVFRGVRRQVGALGFELVMGQSQSRLPGGATTYMALYLNPERGEVARFFTLVVGRMPLRRVIRFVSFVTEFEDRSEVRTSNSPTAPIFPPVGPPDHAFRFPRVKQVPRLLEIHRALARRHQTGPVKLDPIGLDPRAYQYRAKRREMDHLVAHGYYEVDDRRRVLRPTWKGAILMTWKLAIPVNQIRQAIHHIVARRLVGDLESGSREG